MHMSLFWVLLRACYKCGEHSAYRVYRVSFIRYCTFKSSATAESGLDKDTSFHSRQLLCQHKEICHTRNTSMWPNPVVFYIWIVRIVFSLSKMQITRWVYFHFPAVERNSPTAWNPLYDWCRSYLHKSTFRKRPQHIWLLSTHIPVFMTPLSIESRRD